MYVLPFICGGYVHNRALCPGFGWVGGQVVALIKFTGGSDLLLAVTAGHPLFYVFTGFVQTRSEPPSLQFSCDFGITLGFHFDPSGIIYHETCNDVSSIW